MGEGYGIRDFGARIRVLEFQGLLIELLSKPQFSFSFLSKIKYQPEYKSTD